MGSSLRVGILFLVLLLVGRGETARAQATGEGTEANAAQPAPVSIPKLLAEARVLQREYRESEALAKYEEILARDPRRYDALWQASLLSMKIGGRYSDETRKNAYFVLARQYADRSLAVNPDGAEANYAVALSLVTQATLRTAYGRLYAYKEMQPYVFMAVARRPDWADAWALLGRWHFRVDHYNILERAFSSLFLGGMPNGASSRKAVDALVRAHQLDPKRLQFCYDLARVHINRKQFSRAYKVLEEANAIQPITSEDLELSRRCRLLYDQMRRKLKISSPEAPAAPSR
ncbi:tetratricopeptide repeat protein [Hymenobacter jejuensis]|uniref:Tetratricopeptide repeat protein n=1 Tax=Hymenobacter jejuensis TaxID=2502781 RepID=A0A5B8A405_9BACT|nr:tetratricopeptide repeat protein [Hymenobacter jejuensis]QDA62048.1 hypothetical protein FHG12_18925 [Hymenobacter jejuensis]